jgi:hypothetical protein
MAGVAGPMLRFDRMGALRLLAGLLVGEAAAAAVLSVPAYLIGEAAHEFVPSAARLWILAVTCAIFAIADLTGRTPHVWRQVPQRFARTLPPGKRGLVWGFDLGILFTTQKVTSLIWVAIAAGLLLSPAGAVAVLAAIWLVSALVVIVQSVGYRPDGISRRVRRRLLPVLRRVRLGSGTLILGLVVATIVQAWPA